MPRNSLTYLGFLLGLFLMFGGAASAFIFFLVEQYYDQFQGWLSIVVVVVGGITSYMCHQDAEANENDDYSSGDGE